MRHSDSSSRDLVDRIEIGSPCTVPWEGMPGDERVRFCGQCRQNVFNVDALGREEARRLIARQQGRLCVRMLRRPDGTVVTADCWSRLRAARRRGIIPLLATLVLVFFAELAAIGAGLSGLRRLVGSRAVGGTPVTAPCPTAPGVPIQTLGKLSVAGPARLKLDPELRPSVRHMGEVMSPAHLMGRTAHKSSQ
jgi:hypothetical protein